MRALNPRLRHNGRGLALLVCALAAIACSDPPQNSSIGTDAGDGGDSQIGSAFGDTGTDLGANSATDAVSDAPAATDVGTVKKPKKNGFVYECKPLTIESCVTACGSAGHRKCLKEWGGCAPPPEFCGNCVDDDCNGLINEGCVPNPKCSPTPQKCPVAIISITEGKSAGTGTTLHLSAKGSYAQGTAKISK